MIRLLAHLLSSRVVLTVLFWVAVFAGFLSANLGDGRKP